MDLSLHCDINKMPLEGVLLQTVRRAFIMKLMWISGNLQSDPQSATCVRSLISQLSRIQPPVGKSSTRRVRKMNKTLVLLASDCPATFYVSARVRKTQRTIESRTETLRADPSTLPQTAHQLFSEESVEKAPTLLNIPLVNFPAVMGLLNCVCVRVREYLFRGETV